jgi:hypothetical protein
MGAVLGAPVHNEGGRAAVVGCHVVDLDVCVHGDSDGQGVDLCRCRRRDREESPDAEAEQGDEKDFPHDYFLGERVCPLLDVATPAAPVRRGRLQLGWWPTSGGRTGPPSGDLRRDHRCSIGSCKRVRRLPRRRKGQPGRRKRHRRWSQGGGLGSDLGGHAARPTSSGWPPVSGGHDRCRLHDGTNDTDSQVQGAGARTAGERGVCGQAGPPAAGCGTRGSSSVGRLPS